MGLAAFLFHRRVDGGKFQTMNLTVEQIETDIAGFQGRIAKVQAELAALPTGRLPYQQHRKREKIRRACEAEVKHCLQLIKYACEGISIRQGEIIV